MALPWLVPSLGECLGINIIFYLLSFSRVSCPEQRSYPMKQLCAMWLSSYHLLALHQLVWLSLWSINEKLCFYFPAPFYSSIASNLLISQEDCWPHIGCNFENLIECWQTQHWSVATILGCLSIEESFTWKYIIFDSLQICRFPSFIFLNKNLYVDKEDDSLRYDQPYHW